MPPPILALSLAAPNPNSSNLFAFLDAETAPRSAALGDTGGDREEEGIGAGEQKCRPGEGRLGETERQMDAV